MLDYIIKCGVCHEVTGCKGNSILSCDDCILDKDKCFMRNNWEKFNINLENCEKCIKEVSKVYDEDNILDLTRGGF